MIYEQSIQVSPSEIFADMFLGWVCNKWSLDQYGTERGNFMNERMRGWIASAISHQKPEREDEAIEARLSTKCSNHSIPNRVLSCQEYCEFNTHILN